LGSAALALAAFELAALELAALDVALADLDVLADLVRLLRAALSDTASPVTRWLTARIMPRVAGVSACSTA